jgi:hypothetical protein
MNSKDYRHNYYLLHKKEKQQKSKLWSLNNKDKSAKYQSKWRDNQSMEDKKEEIKSKINSNRLLRLRVISKLGSKCSNPFDIDHSSFEKEIDYIRCLQIDHIDGGGSKELENIGRSRLHRKILKDSTGYQLLCANCNWLKRFKKNETN